MKILLYTLIFPPDTCSNSFIFADLTKELIKLGDQVTVITTTPHYDEEHAEEKKKTLATGKKNWYKISNYYGASVYHIDVETRKGNIKDRIRTFYRFHKYSYKLLSFENIEADVVICQTPPMTIGFDCNKIAKKLKAKSVMILQDLWLDAQLDAGRIKGFMAKLLRCVEIKAYKKLDLITTIDEKMGERVYQISGIQPTIIPNFVDVSVYEPYIPNDEDYEKYGVKKEDFILSYVGNIGEGQDLEPLIQYAKHNNSVKVIIAGNGKKESYYKERVKTMNINNVHFVGYVEREEARIINGISNVCTVMLAKHATTTGFPSKIYSLMSMGKSIVISCSARYEAGFFVEKNDIGWRCDVNSPEQFSKTLDMIALHKELCIEKGNKARSIILSKYSSGIVVLQYKEAIENLSLIVRGCI